MIVAVDTGGTKTLVTLFSKDGVAGEMIRFPTPKKKSEYLTVLRKTLRDNYGGQRIEAIVIGMPGIVKNNVVVWCNSLKWKDFDIVNDLKGTLGSTPIYIENDANLGGLSETRSRKPISASSLYITVSTGIGTGITTEGKIDSGLRLSEGGRMLVEFGGEIREWESFASGRAIVEAYGRYAREIKDKPTWDEIADRISRGLLAAIPLLQTDVIIIGGSIGTYFSHYADSLENILRKHLPAHIPCPTIVEAQHPEEAVIYGCYYYAIDALDT